MSEPERYKPALWDAGWLPRARHLALVTRLTIRCALRGHTVRCDRPTRCVEVAVCQECGNYVGASVNREDPEAPCLWFRPSMVKRTKAPPTAE